MIEPVDARQRSKRFETANGYLIESDGRSCTSVSHPARRRSNGSFASGRQRRRMRRNAGVEDPMNGRWGLVDPHSNGRITEAPLKNRPHFAGRRLPHPCLPR
jgi:hypothetical protein